MVFTLKDICVKDIISISNLTIPSQAITCIVGQSGSGKSTLLRLLNNLDNPDEGTIYYRENDVRTIDPIELRRKIRMVPQTPVMYQGSIKDNLIIALKFSEQNIVSDDQLLTVLELVRLDKDLEVMAEDLSGGEKQRLALARAMLLDAEVFLLDEPSSSLDEQTASDVINAFIKQIKEKKKTAIIVTHDTKLAEKISDKTIYMNNYTAKEDK